VDKNPSLAAMDPQHLASSSRDAGWLQLRTFSDNLDREISAVQLELASTKKRCTSSEMDMKSADEALRSAMKEAEELEVGTPEHEIALKDVHMKKMSSAHFRMVFAQANLNRVDAELKVANAAVFRNNDKIKSLVLSRISFVSALQNARKMYNQLVALTCTGT
jgi:hypothetical protein